MSARDNVEGRSKDFQFATISILAQKSDELHKLRNSEIKNHNKIVETEPLNDKSGNVRMSTERQEYPTKNQLDDGGLVSIDTYK